MPYISLEKSCATNWSPSSKWLHAIWRCFDIKLLPQGVFYIWIIDLWYLCSVWMWVCMVCIHVVSLVFFYYCVTHRGVVLLCKVSDQSCRIWGSGRSLYSMKSLSPCVAIWARFLIVVYGNSLHLALVCWLWQNTWPQWKKRSVTSYKRNSDHNN